MPKPSPTLIILGGTSAVAMEYARIQAERGRHICLVGRNTAKLNINAADLSARGAETVAAYVCDLGDTKNIKSHWAKIISQSGKADEVLLAYSVLGDQGDSQSDVVLLKSYLETNFLSAAMWSELALDHFIYEGAGQLSVIGSVAGDRGRQSNYHYGSAKGALEIMCDGMSHRAARTPEAKVNVLLVKPGFIDTPMTDHLDKGGPLWATPEKIAQIIDKAVKRKKQKIYAPWFWRFILMIIRATPRFVFHKTGL